MNTAINVVNITNISNNLARFLEVRAVGYKNIFSSSLLLFPTCYIKNKLISFFVFLKKNNPIDAEMRCLLKAKQVSHKTIKI